MPASESPCRGVSEPAGMLFTSKESEWYKTQPRVILRGTQEASLVMEMMTEDMIRKEPSFSDYLRRLHSNIILNI